MNFSRGIGTAIWLVIYAACSNVSWAQDDAIRSARKLADDYLMASSDPSFKGFDYAEAISYGHVTAFYYSEQRDLGDGWKGGRHGPTVFVDRDAMAVVGVQPPAIGTPRPIFVGGNMSDELASNVTSYFRKRRPDFDIANYNFFLGDAGGISFLYVERKYGDRGIYNCKCKLVVENKSNRILGSALNWDSMYSPRSVK